MHAHIRQTVAAQKYVPSCPSWRVYPRAPCLYVPYISKKALLVQNDRYLWLIPENGKRQKKYVLDIDCTTCSDAVRIIENNYAVNSDLGIHVFELPQVSGKTKTKK